MPRTLTVLFRRDPSRDRTSEDIRFEGYRTLWPDGRPVTLGLDSLCHHGQRLFGLGLHMKGRSERLVELLCFPLRFREDDLTRLPGVRVRRFLMQREGNMGRLHFLDGTPTQATFQIGRDDPRFLKWLGLSDLPTNGGQWFDLAARPAEITVSTEGQSALMQHAAVGQ